MESATPPKSLALKICSIMDEITRVPKSGRNETQKYDFASESDITDLLRPLMAKHHVCIFVNMDAVEQTEFVSKNGAPGTNTKATFTFTLIDADSGESQACQWTAEAMDYQDKGINKVSTAAMKYFLIRTFQISTGDSADDADSSTPEPGKKSTHTETFQRSQQQFIPQRQPAGDDAKQSLLGVMNKLGVEVYGDDWPAQRQTVVQEITKNPNVPVDKLMIPTIQSVIDKLTAEKTALASTPPAQPAGEKSVA